MTQTTNADSGGDALEQRGTGIVDLSTTPHEEGLQEETGTHGAHALPYSGQEDAPNVDVVSSNTENPFEEENTEGFDIAPNGKGNLP